MTQSPALDHGAPILERREFVKWRDENTVYIQARKCKCNSVWCASCSKQGWAKRAAMDLREFDWKRTREILVTFKREQFKDGKEAYEYAMEHKLIPGLIRNIKRGKHVKIGKKWVWKYRPVEIRKYITFLEWHKDGWPHFHVMVETEELGAKAMIGGHRIRHYWPAGTWVRETPIISRIHWDRKVGYLQKHGYFQEDKKHQTRLPEWALDTPGLKIRRSSHSRRCEGNGQGVHSQDQDEREAWIIDPLTGEPLAPETVTYRKRIDFCGRCTFLRLCLRGKEVDGLFKIPYRKVRKDYQGQYQAGIGYIFHVSIEEAEKLLSEMILEEEKGYPKSRWLKQMEAIKHWCPDCEDWTYQKVRSVQDDAEIYVCLGCKILHGYKKAEQENSRGLGVK